MLGFSLGEVILIAVVAIVVLGPDKLPGAIMQLAKFFKLLRKTLDDAKSTLDKELHIEELKREALEYRQKFEKEVQGVNSGLEANLDIKHSIAGFTEPLKENLNDINNMFKDYKPKRLDLDAHSYSKNSDNLEYDNNIANDNELLSDSAIKDQQIEDSNNQQLVNEHIVINQLNEEIAYDDFKEDIVKEELNQQSSGENIKAKEVSNA